MSADPEPVIRTSRGALRGGRRRVQGLTCTLTTMLRARSLLRVRPTYRTYTTAANTHALVFLEHRDGVLDSGSLSAVTAAEKLGGEVTGLVVGSSEEVKLVLPKAQK